MVFIYMMSIPREMWKSYELYLFIIYLVLGYQCGQNVCQGMTRRQQRYADAPISEDQPGDGIGESSPSARRPGQRRTVCDEECVCELPRAECKKANLRSIPSPFPRGIEKIIIEENPLNVIKQNSFYKPVFSTVTNLQLNDNQIKTLETQAFNGLSNVRELSIRGNKIKSIGEMAFYGLRNLETLTLSSNQLKELSSNSFPFGISIKTIALNDNKLQSISSELFDALPSLQTLSLGGNPWNCDCDLFGIFVWLQLPNTDLMEPYGECAKPSNVAGKSIKGFTNKEMQRACIEDDGEDEGESVDEQIDEACAEHNSTDTVHICYISDTVFTQSGKKVCLHCAATVDPLEIERDIAEEGGNELLLQWDSANYDEDLTNDTFAGTICFRKMATKNAGEYSCTASFGNSTDQRIVTIVINDLANRVAVGLASFFGAFLVIVLLLLSRWWFREVRGDADE